MKKHTEIYLNALGYDVGDFISSELSGARAIDIHHIDSRGIGGNPSKNKDRIENLQALTREEHLKYGDNLKYLKMLYKKHYDFLENNGVKFDKDYLIKKING